MNNIVMFFSALGALIKDMPDEKTFLKCVIDVCETLLADDNEFTGVELEQVDEEFTDAELEQADDLTNIDDEMQKIVEENGAKDWNEHVSNVEAEVLSGPDLEEQIEEKDEEIMAKYDIEILDDTVEEIVKPDRERNKEKIHVKKRRPYRRTT